MSIANKLYESFFAPVLRRLGFNNLVVARFSPDAYLRQTGWLLSDRLRRPVDAAGKPIPWVNYPAMEFIASRLSPDWRVFEYGSGFSTLWWAARVREVVAVEHNKDWHQRMKRETPENAKVVFSELDGTDDYSMAITREEGLFDVVVVDGRRRVKCALSAIGKLSPSGVLVVDDWQRKTYHPIGNELAAREWRFLAFTGMKPCDAESSTAAVFYRPAGNVLGI